MTKKNIIDFFENHPDYKFVIKNLKTAACIISLKGEILFSNAACDNCFETKKVKLEGKNLKELIGSGEFKSVKKWEKEANKTYEFNISIGKKRTKHLRFKPSAILDQDKKYVGFLVELEDIETDNKIKKLENKIHALEKKRTFKDNLLFSLLHNTPDRIYFKDKESRFIKVSRSFLETLDLKNSEEVINKTDFDFYTKSHAEQAYKEEQEIIKTKKPVKGKIIKETSLDGKIAWVSTTKAPWYDENGKVIGILGITKDISREKELEEKLKKKTEKLGEEVVFKSNLLASLLDNIPDHIYFKDKKSRFIQASKSVAEQLGLKNVRELIGKTDFDYFTKEHAEQAFRDEQKIIKKGTSIEGKIEKETYPDGKIAWVSTTKIPRYDEKGNITGTLGISRDVTRQKETEKKLIESEARNKAILSALPDLLFQIKKDGTFIAYYTGKESNLYTKPENFINKKVQDILPEDIAQQAVKSTKEAIKTGKIVSFEYNLTVKNEIKDWEARFAKIDKETAIVLMRDITNIKKAETEIHKLNDLIEQSTNPILRMTPEMHIDYANKATKSFFGYTFSELKGKTLEFLMAEANSEQIQRDIYTNVSAGKTYSKEHLNIRKNGSVFFCLMNIMPLFEENGKTYGYMASLIDVTKERKTKDGNI